MAIGFDWEIASKLKALNAMLDEKEKTNAMLDEKEKTNAMLEETKT